MYNQGMDTKDTQTLEDLIDISIAEDRAQDKSRDFREFIEITSE